MGAAGRGPRWAWAGGGEERRAARWEAARAPTAPIECARHLINSSPAPRPHPSIPIHHCARHCCPPARPHHTHTHTHSQKKCLEKETSEQQETGKASNKGRGQRPIGRAIGGSMHPTHHQSTTTAPPPAARSLFIRYTSSIKQNPVPSPLPAHSIPSFLPFFLSAPLPLLALAHPPPLPSPFRFASSRLVSFRLRER